MQEMRLIDANALDAKLDELMIRYSAQGRKAVADDYNFVRTVLLTAPTVDAVEVVHGRWTPVDVIAKKAGYSVRYYHHAECKVNPCRLFECMDDYCPNCGAKMDGDGNG